MPKETQQSNAVLDIGIAESQGINVTVEDLYNSVGDQNYKFHHHHIKPLAQKNQSSREYIIKKTTSNGAVDIKIRLPYSIIKKDGNLYLIAPERASGAFGHGMRSILLDPKEPVENLLTKEGLEKIANNAKQADISATLQEKNHLSWRKVSNISYEFEEDAQDGLKQIQHEIKLAFIADINNDDELIKSATELKNHESLHRDPSKDGKALTILSKESIQPLSDSDRITLSEFIYDKCHPEAKIVQKENGRYKIEANMPIANGMELKKYLDNHNISSLSMADRTIIFKNFSDTLKYLHEKGIYHGDLKPENIIIDPTTKKIKIIDFGFSETSSSNYSKLSLGGTPIYAAPEIIANVWKERIKLLKKISPPQNFEDLKKADLFSAGEIMCDILGLPFPKKSLKNWDDISHFMNNGHDKFCQDYLNTNTLEEYFKNQLRNNLQQNLGTNDTSTIPDIENKFFNIYNGLVDFNPDKRPSLSSVKKEIEQIENKIKNPSSHSIIYNSYQKPVKNNLDEMDRLLVELLK